MKDYFTLQLFAAGDPVDYTTNSTINNIHGTTSNGLTVEMKEFYSKDLIETASAQLVHQQFCDKVSIPRNGGRTIEWRKFTKFPKALKALTEGVTPSPTKIDASKISQTLNEFGAWSAVTDLIDMTAIDDIIVEITNKHAESMGLTLDTIVRNEMFAGCTQYIYPEGANDVEDGVTSAMHLTPKLIAEAVTVLKKQNAPKINGSYVAIVHPSVVYDIITSDDWIKVHKYSDAQAIFEGEIGSLYGVRFVESTEAMVKSNESGAKVYGCMFLGKGAIKSIDVGGAGAEVIVKPLGSGDDPLNQRSTVGWKVPMFGAKVVIPEYMVCVWVGSSLDGKIYGNTPGFNTELDIDRKDEVVTNTVTGTYADGGIKYEIK